MSAGVISLQRFRDEHRAGRAELDAYAGGWIESMLQEAERQGRRITRAQQREAIAMLQEARGER